VRAIVVHPGPFFSVADVHNGWVKGLRSHGVDVLDFNLHDRLNFYSAALLEKGGEIRRAFDHETAAVMAAKGLEVACYEWWPDLVVVVSGFYIPPDMYAVMRDRGHHVVLLCTESPYEDIRQSWMAKAADTVILNDPTNLDDLRELNPRTVYIPHGYDPDVHRPGPADPDLVSDFCFVGTGYPSRIEFLEQVDWDGLDVTFAGNWKSVAEDSPIRRFCPDELDQCIDNPDAIRLYQSTKVSANLYRKEAMASEDVEGWAVGPREVELAATGTFFLREPRGEGDQLFPFLPTFETPDEFGKLVRWWAEHDDDRHAAAERARQAVQDRTFHANAERLLRLISG
jgi:spore maturation protein CgeB